jgi:hypothetical protein
VVWNLDGSDITVLWNDRLGLDGRKEDDTAVSTFGKGRACCSVGWPAASVGSTGQNHLDILRTTWIHSSGTYNSGYRKVRKKSPLNKFLVREKCLQHHKK